LKKEELLKNFKEKTYQIPSPNLSDRSQYRKFCAKLSEEIIPKIEALDRLQLESLAKAHTKVFGLGGTKN